MSWCLSVYLDTSVLVISHATGPLGGWEVIYISTTAQYWDIRPSFSLCITVKHHQSSPPLPPLLTQHYNTTLALYSFTNIPTWVHNYQLCTKELESQLFGNIDQTFSGTVQLKQHFLKVCWIYFYNRPLPRNPKPYDKHRRWYFIIWPACFN